MIVRGTEIPESFIEALDTWIQKHAFTACQLEAAATRELLRVSITDPERMVPHRLADRLIQNLRKCGAIEMTQRGRSKIWSLTANRVLH